MTFTKRKFAYQHPLFGRGKEQKSFELYKNSVYFYWYEFLKRSVEYQKCCNSGGKGKLSNIYKDFGDVFTNDFKTWWQTQERGAYLFAEGIDYTFKEIINEEELVLDKNVINIQIPISYSKRTITKLFNAFLKKRHPGSRGKRNNLISTALYPVIGKVDKYSLEKALIVYDLHKNTNLKLWEIGLTKGIAPREYQFKKEEWKGKRTAEKAVLSSTVNRLIRRAEKLIKNAENGKFPNLG